MQFKVEAITAFGQEVLMTVIAQTVTEVRTLVEQQGYQVMSISQPLVQENMQ